MTGFNAGQITANLRAVGEAQRKAAAKGLFDAAEHVLQVSRTRVPIEEGTLERSGTTTVDEANLVAYISYDTPYAVRQHEDMTYRHDAGRQAKFLESALTGERDVVRKIIADAIKGAS